MKLDKDKLAIAMAERLLTAKALANLAGITPATAIKVLKGNNCSIPTAGKIAKALGVPVKELV